jgi:hypothetical protein
MLTPIFALRKLQPLPVAADRAGPGHADHLRDNFGGAGLKL